MQMSKFTVRVRRWGVNTGIAGIGTSEYDEKTQKERRAMEMEKSGVRREKGFPKREFESECVLGYRERGKSNEEGEVGGEERESFLKVRTCGRRGPTTSMQNSQ